MTYAVVTVECINYTVEVFSISFSARMFLCLFTGGAPAQMPKVTSKGGEGGWEEKEASMASV